MILNVLRRRSSALLVSSFALAWAAAACSNTDDNGSVGAGGDGSASGSPSAGGGDSTDAGSPGPQDAQVNEFHHPIGPDLDNGREVYRFETFGNEGFWTRALRLPQGMES